MMRAYGYAFPVSLKWGAKDRPTITTIMRSLFR
jgi:hypothetical protein